MIAARGEVDTPRTPAMPWRACRRTRGSIAGVLGLFAMLAAQPARALIINIDAPGISGTPAMAAFQRAAGAWEAVFSDPVEVTISADLLPLASPSVLGQTRSIILAAPYDAIRDAMVADGLAESDDGVVAYLPTAGEFTATVLGFAPGVAFGLTGNLSATKANLKALEFDAVFLDTVFGPSDATIEFNSDFPFDFDSSDGISPGLTDFETVAAHEIGHVLGFDSVVDTVDVLAAFGFVTDISPRTLDLFRFREGEEPGTPAEFTTTARLLVPGFPDFVTFEDQFPALFADLDDVFPLSTGFFLGDGRQASHWKDDNFGNPLVGLMDPSLARGQTFHISAADIRALDLIGWDFDPAVGEPPSGALLFFSLVIVYGFSARVTPASSRRSRRRLSRACPSPGCAPTVTS